jgi:flagellar biosynthetic protein FliO
MNRSAYRRFACLLFFVGFLLLCPELFSASQNEESGASKLKFPAGQQQIGDLENVGSVPQSSFPDVPLQTPNSSVGESQISVTKTVGSILFILALILVFAFCLKRYMPLRFEAGGKRRLIHILENVSLGEKRSLTLIRIDQENLLLANTPTSISLIKEINLQQPLESAEDERPRSNKHSSEPDGPAVDEKPAAGRRRSHITFSDLMASELNDSHTPVRDGIHQVLSRLSQIRRELRTKFGNS